MLCAKNINTTAFFFSLLAKYFNSADINQQCGHSLKCLYSSFAIWKNSNSTHFTLQKKKKQSKRERKRKKRGSYSPTLLHETIFGYKQTQTAHTRDRWPGALFAVYRQEYPAEKDSQGLWNPAREQENLLYGISFPAVSCSEELKICQNTLPFVTLLIEMYILHSVSYSDVSTNVAHEFSPYQSHSPANKGHRLTPTPKQLPVCTKMYPHPS